MTEYYSRFIEADIQDSLNANKICILLGARQTGKSTLLSNLLPSAQLIINLQNPKERTLYEKNPNALQEILTARPEKELTILIDEIQKVPKLLDLIQYLYDQNKSKYHFLLTGSSARKLVQKSANLLPGRSHLYRLFPVSLTERNQAGILPLDYQPDHPFQQTNLESLLLFGSLPVIESESEKIKAKTLESYVEIYLEEEIRRENVVNDVGIFANFLELAAIESGKPINYSRLSSETGVSVNTIKSYYQILIDTFIGFSIPAFTKNPRKRVLSRDKFLFFDNGVRNASAKWGFHPNLLKVSSGDFFEHWVGLELAYKAAYHGPSTKLFYYRTMGGAEIDYILQTPDELIPIEVKYSANPAASHAGHIETFIAEMPSAKRGYVVCRCDQPRRISEHVTAIPWTHL